MNKISNNIRVAVKVGAAVVIFLAAFYLFKGHGKVKDIGNMAEL